MTTVDQLLERHRGLESHRPKTLTETLSEGCAKLAEENKRLRNKILCIDEIARRSVMQLPYPDRRTRYFKMLAFLLKEEGLSNSDDWYEFSPGFWKFVNALK